MKSFFIKNTKLLFVYILFLNISCTSDGDDNVIEQNNTEISCGYYNGNALYTGPRGGCYYYSENETKVYVDRSNCKC